MPLGRSHAIPRAFPGGRVNRAAAVERFPIKHEGIRAGALRDERAAHLAQAHARIVLQAIVPRIGCAKLAPNVEALAIGDMAS
jgi:hypothetical protein